MSEPAELDRDESKPLHCPKCTAVMDKVLFLDIIVDRCTACRGLWFDALEEEHLAAIKGSEVIDVGIASHPATTPVTHKAKLNCPVCHTPMIDMVDHRHPNVRFESCTVCYGVFFDRGEFRESKEHHIFETFRRWLGR